MSMESIAKAVKPEKATDTTSIRYYRNGAHAGNVIFKIEGWGMNSLETEAAIKRNLEGFISGLQFDQTSP